MTNYDLGLQNASVDGIGETPDLSTRVENEHAGSIGLDEQALAKQEDENSKSSRKINSKSETDGGLYSTAKESGGQIANQALGQAKAKAASVIEEQKRTLVSGLDNIAHGIRQVGENMSSSDEPNDIANITLKYGDVVADKIETISTYVENKEFGEIVSDVKGLARRHPALFFGGAFLLGIATARFLKSSSAAPALSGKSSYRELGDSPSANEMQSSLAASA